MCIVKPFFMLQLKHCQPTLHSHTCSIYFNEELIVFSLFVIQNEKITKTLMLLGFCLLTFFLAYLFVDYKSYSKCLSVKCQEHF